VNPHELHLHQAVRELQARYAQQLNQVSAATRIGDKKLDALAQQVAGLEKTLNAVSATRSGGDDAGTIRIEDIPGRRVPYTLLVDIPIGANTTSKRQASVTISQEGPFVAVARTATFQSSFEFQSNDLDTGDVGRFAGRSFGRYRPIHSAWDLNDSQHNAVADTSLYLWSFLANNNAAAGDPMPQGVLGLPSSMSSFRTMEFDARITILNAGSSYPRQNISVPSSMWTTQINSPFELGALDFFERGEVITFEVQPNHVNNPPAGNVTGRAVLPLIAGLGNAGGFPFVGGQFDAHEGIATPGGITLERDAPEDPTYVDLLVNDSIQRLPDGILTIGFEGYRIIQPVGPVG
jgi:hypothetical protein